MNPFTKLYENLMVEADDNPASEDTQQSVNEFEQENVSDFERMLNYDGCKEYTVPKYPISRMSLPEKGNPIDKGVGLVYDVSGYKILHFENKEALDTYNRKVHFILLDKMTELITKKPDQPASAPGTEPKKYTLDTTPTLKKEQIKKYLDGFEQYFSPEQLGTLQRTKQQAEAEFAKQSPSLLVLSNPPSKLPLNTPFYLVGKQMGIALKTVVYLTYELKNGVKTNMTMITGDGGFEAGIEPNEEHSRDRIADIFAMRWKLPRTIIQPMLNLIYPAKQ